MKLLKAASLALMIGVLPAASVLAQEATSPATMEDLETPVQKNAQATALKNAQAAAATANAAKEPEVDPVEVKARTREHLTYLFQYSMTLPEKERKPYTDLLFAGGMLIQKVDRGLLPAKTLDAKLKELEKFYEGDSKLTPKEAQSWGASIAPLAGPQRRAN